MEEMIRKVLMLQLDVSVRLFLVFFDMESCLISTDESQAPAGPSVENIDQNFDFQIVVFEV